MSDKKIEDEKATSVEKEAAPAQLSAQLSAELTEKEKLQLEAEARAEVLKDMKAAAKAEFKEAAKRRIQAEQMFHSGKDDSGEDLDTVDLKLATFPRYIILDGTVYHSGRRYTKKRSVIAVLKDQMSRGWRQEAARLGEKVEIVLDRQMTLSQNGLSYH